MLDDQGKLQHTLTYPDAGYACASMCYVTKTQQLVCAFTESASSMLRRLDHAETEIQISPQQLLNPLESLKQIHIATPEPARNVKICVYQNDTLAASIELPILAVSLMVPTGDSVLVAHTPLDRLFKVSLSDQSFDTLVNTSFFYMEEKLTVLRTERGTVTCWACVSIHPIPKCIS